MTDWLNRLRRWATEPSLGCPCAPGIVCAKHRGAVAGMWTDTAGRTWVLFEPPERKDLPDHGG